MEKSFIAKPKRAPLTRLWYATGYSLKGLKACAETEAAFRLELALFIVLLPLAFYLGESAVEIALLAAPLFLVLICELANSAIECLVDRISLEKHPLSGKAKDIGSAMVMVSLCNFFIVWSCTLFL